MTIIQQDETTDEKTVPLSIPATVEGNVIFIGYRLFEGTAKVGGKEVEISAVGAMGTRVGLYIGDKTYSVDLKDVVKQILEASK